jgi:hypothetical protein
MILSPDDLVALTRRNRPKAQTRVLRLLGIPSVPHPVDGTLIVSRAAAEAVLGVTIGKESEQQFDVNVQAIREYGTTTHDR